MTYLPLDSTTVYRLTPYVSYKPDPGAVAVEAFTVQWSQYVFYAFPPFSVITRTLQKIQQDQATGLLVVPFWPTQTRWPPLTRMLIQAPLVLPKRKITLYLPQDPVRCTHCTVRCLYSSATCPTTFAESRNFIISFRHYHAVRAYQHKSPIQLLH